MPHPLRTLASGIGHVAPRPLALTESRPYLLIAMQQHLPSPLSYAPLGRRLGMTVRDLKRMIAGRLTPDLFQAEAIATLLRLSLRSLPDEFRKLQAWHSGRAPARRDLT